ncbi:MAG TPA: four helix bundle protein [Candidatus Saccharimonadales bacterium]|nr:four helix bundle protein [Candidatus Saccharimonadales bacterium]
MSKSLDATLSIVEKTYQIYKRLVVIDASLPDKHRPIGEQTQRTMNDLLQLFFIAQHAPKVHKGAYLLKAQAQLEVLNLQLRLYLDLKLANETKLFQLLADLQEVGRMLGGWLKAST